MRSFVHLHRKILASWVFSDSRRLQLFIYLLAKADEKGCVKMSVRKYAECFDVDRNWVGRCLREMAERNIIEPKVGNKRTILNICKFEYYNTLAAEDCAESEPKVRNTGTPKEEKEGNRERKFPPHPFIKKEINQERQELSATSLRCASENEGEWPLYQEIKEENDCAAVNDAFSSPKAPSTKAPKTSLSEEREVGPVPTFQQFWDAYAFKRERRPAERAWKSLSAADRRAAYETIETYRADCRRYERKMVYARKYLLYRRWEDDFTSSPYPGN